MAEQSHGAQLEIRDLTIEYVSGGYVVRPIKNLDLEVGSGELVLLLGVSGCGKTTLLSAIAGILTPSAGMIRFGDTEITALHGASLTEYRLFKAGIVFQAFNLIPSLTALENVQTPMWAAGVKGKEAKRRSHALLERVGLSERMQHHPGDLSGGQQQRVAIARAMANNPPLILADEPTAHLDYLQVEGILQLLREVAGPGRVVVVATHDERLLPLADRIVELSPRRPGDEARPPERRELAAGEILFEEGDAGDLVYVVEDGKIELVRARADGGEEVLAVVGPPQYFGELAPVFGLQRSATARAEVPSVVTGYSVADFRKMVRPGSITELITQSSS